MNRVTKSALLGSGGIALLVLAMWVWGDPSVRQLAAIALLPLGMLVSLGVYGMVCRQAPVAGALAVAIPLFVGLGVVRQWLLPLPDGFSWPYALASGTVGAIWGCVLPTLARRGDEESNDA